VGFEFQCGPGGQFLHIVKCLDSFPKSKSPRTHFAIPHHGRRHDAACYFCLEEGSDDEGKSLVRDCACRGDSAGFAHLSCLTKYAEQKWRKVGDRDVIAIFAEPWEKCNNCKQTFQNQLAVDLSSAFVSFAEAIYGQPGNSKWDKLRVMDPLRTKIMVSSKLSDTGTERKEELNTKLLSMIDKTKNELNMSRWIHMPQHSDEYQYYRTLCSDFEAFAYNNLGAISTMKGTHIANGFMSLCGIQDAMVHFKKARAIFNLVGIKDEAKQMECKISLCTGAIEAAKKKETLSTRLSVSLPELRNKYEHNLNTIGMNSEGAIRSGLNYAGMLRLSFHFIEAQRLLTKLATNSRRVLGTEHKTTNEADEMLEKCKLREVRILSDNKPYHALRYENDGEFCVIQGPILEPRNIEEERISQTTL